MLPHGIFGNSIQTGFIASPLCEQGLAYPNAAIHKWQQWAEVEFPGFNGHYSGCP